MGFLDDARRAQAQNDARLQRDAEALARDELLFTDAMVEQYAQAIAEGMRRALQEKIRVRYFKFVYGSFHRKKHCHYEEDYRAKIERRPKTGFPPAYASSLSDPHDCRDANARPAFPSRQFLSIHNPSDYESSDQDTIYCWSFDHVRKPYERAVKLLRADGIDARLTLSDFGYVEDWKTLWLHASIRCDDEGNV